MRFFGTHLRQRIFAFTLLLALVPLHARAAEITVFAAASLSDALQEISREYTRAHTGVTVRFNFAASSTLGRQIREGAPADIFFSADEAQMDALAARELIIADTRRTLLSNTLVVIVSARDNISMSAPTDLLAPEIRRIAIGEPSTVPAGVYARVWLTRIGLWEKLNSHAKIIPCENVRAALAAVESGNVDAAIVYNTDALSSSKVRVAFKISAGAPDIAYPVDVMQNTRNFEAARKFADNLRTQESIAIFNRLGFLPTHSSDSTEAARQ